jgi:hypothetical protein
MTLGLYQGCLDEYRWICPKKNGKARTTIRKDSHFERSRLPLSKLFMMLYCVLKYDKMLNKDMADICGVSENSMVDWANFIREAVSHYYLINPQKIGGSRAVQIDESLFGGRVKYHRGDH